MGMPVKLSDELVTLARAEAAASNRSIAAQVEHWARVGRAAERALAHAETLALKSEAPLHKAFPREARRSQILNILENLGESVDRDALREQLKRADKPIYSSDPENPDLVIQIHPDGTRIRGRIENREFIPVS